MTMRKLLEKILAETRKEHRYLGRCVAKDCELATRIREITAVLKKRGA